MIRKASNRFDFDYRHLRNPDNMPRYEAVSKILEGEPTQFMVFTVLAQVSSLSSVDSIPTISELAESMEEKWMEILVSATLVYLLDADCSWKDAF